ncbi:Acetamidase/Formamidase [Methylobacterium sp. 4-46]|uniref:acetamidase/formamidase family protein n=1 Tax=unclassified Methylobacterium TaxID=2615210 RepID=UPI000152BF7F|nr:MULTISPECIES: acetamidase/formamidase family protein [Methylobacterium]ACA16127.1 Acetamidase/Formamidase [Methylobacterium sp. 4-46]WFT81837.1 acetamidase/formamidase family protein [Methylobacterium nodulans]
MPTHHEIPATPENMVLGYFDARRPPVLTVESGDTVTLSSFPAGGRESLHPDPARVPADYLAALDAHAPGYGPHFVTGPVHVRGALPGDVLQVDILDIAFRQDWGFVAILPLLGTLPDEFTEYETIHPDIDVARGVCTLPWGTDLPLDPFFGILATAPPRAWGRVGSPVPRAFGGNMDNKELKVGTRLYLPVFNEGAGFYAGDGHGVQGDGEVCVTALETGLTGTFRLTLRKDLDHAWPFAETPTDLMAIGLHESLDEAMRQAVREMVKHVCARTSLSRNQAYMLCSLAGNLRITQTVDGNKGVHMLMPKSALPKSALPAA